MSRRDLLRLVTNPGHIVAIETHDHALFGRTYRPVCIEDQDPVTGCNWRGGFIASEARARAIGEEHRRKSAGTWRPSW